MAEWGITIGSALDTFGGGLAWPLTLCELDTAGQPELVREVGTTVSGVLDTSGSGLAADADWKWHRRRTWSWCRRRAPVGWASPSAARWTFLAATWRLTLS